MKELVEEWFTTVAATLVGLVITGLWGFREKVHAQRYTDVDTRLKAVEQELDEMQKEHGVIVERVDTIKERQEKIATVVGDTHDAVTRIEGYLKAKSENG